MDSLEFLPVEITLDILTRVPTQSVLDCKLVSKAWYNLVRHPSFSKMHLQRLNDPVVDSGKLGFITFTNEKEFYYFEYNENHDELATPPIQGIRRINLTSEFRCTSFVGSYNGLMCFARGPSVWICNPITREKVMLPEIKVDCIDFDPYRNLRIGFGYVSSTNEYKVVGIYSSETKFVQVNIYTLGSGKGWRKIGNTNFECYGYWQPCIYAGEVLYCLDYERRMIVSFDFAKEMFYEPLSPPPNPPGSDCLYYRIWVFDGILYFVMYLDIGGDDFKEIWRLKRKNYSRDMKEQLEEQQSLGWSKEFKTTGRTGRTLFAITKGDRALTYDSCYLNIYDIKNSTSKRLFEFKDSFLQITPHANTMVSLKELGEENTNIMESVDIKETRSRDYSFEHPGGSEP